MGIIGACLPLMRQPLAHIFPSLLRSHSSRRTPHYSDDQKASPYGLQDLPGRQNDRPHETWHSVPAAGLVRFKGSGPRGSDELGIVSDTKNVGNGRSHDDVYGRTWYEEA